MLCVASAVVRVYTSPGEVKKSPTKLSHIYQCVGCDTFTLQPLARKVVKGNNEKIVPGQGPPVNRECEHCGKVHHVGGPIWSAPMHDNEFVAELLKSLQHGEGAELASARRLIGMLTSVQEEVRPRRFPRMQTSACAALTGAETVRAREQLPDVPLFNQLNACLLYTSPSPRDS